MQVHFNLPAQQQLLHHQSDNSMDYSDFDASDDLDDEEEYINSRGRIVRRPASAGRAYAQAGRKPIRKVLLLLLVWGDTYQAAAILP